MGILNKKRCKIIEWSSFVFSQILFGYLFFNKDNGIIKNKEDLKNISNIKKIVRQLYNNDETNMQFTFDKIYPGYLKYYNDG